jgi:hypothetical protein
MGSGGAISAIATRPAQNVVIELYPSPCPLPVTGARE